MTQGINCKGKAEEQIVADHHPGNLDCIGSLGYCIQKDTADCQKNAGSQNPGTGFALGGSCTVDHSADDKAGNAAEQLGNQRHHGQNAACQSQNIGIELSQISACNAGIHHVYQTRAKEIAQDLLASVCIG